MELEMKMEMETKSRGHFERCARDKFCAAKTDRGFALEEGKNDGFHTVCGVGKLRECMEQICGVPLRQPPPVTARRSVLLVTPLWYSVFLSRN